jgi:hypothetical protein
MSLKTLSYLTQETASSCFNLHNFIEKKKNVQVHSKPLVHRYENNLMELNHKILQTVAKQNNTIK